MKIGLVDVDGHNFPNIALKFLLLHRMTFRRTRQTRL